MKTISCLVIHNFFTSLSRHKYKTTLAAISTVCIPSARTNYGKFNIRFKGPVLWNNIHVYYIMYIILYYYIILLYYYIILLYYILYIIYYIIIYYILLYIIIYYYYYYYYYYILLYIIYYILYYYIIILLYYYIIIIIYYYIILYYENSLLKYSTQIAIYKLKVYKKELLKTYSHFFSIKKR